MGKNKLERFRINELRDNVIQPGKPLYENIKGRWNELYFKNNHDIVLELACGRGEYTTGLAALFPDKNFIGVDIKGARIWKGSTVAEENKLANAAFLRTRILELENFFSVGEVSEIRIVFPDPQPGKRNTRKRLTHPRFLDLYRRVMIPSGTVHLKTDNQALFEYTLEVLAEQRIVPEIVTDDLYRSDYLHLHHGIQTAYERSFLQAGSTIKYIRFRI